MLQKFLNTKILNWNIFNTKHSQFTAYICKWYSKLEIRAEIPKKKAVMQHANKHTCRRTLFGTTLLYITTCMRMPLCCLLLAWVANVHVNKEIFIFTKFWICNLHTCTCMCTNVFGHQKIRWKFKAQKFFGTSFSTNVWHYCHFFQF